MNDPTTAIDNNSDYSLDDLDDGPLLHTRIAFASAWVIIAVAGIIGNSLVILVAIRFQKMNNVTNCFIVNLAITDIVFLAFCMPLLVAQYTLDHWLFNEIFCKLLNFTSFVSVLVTVLTLVTMTIDRYIYVVRPFENIRWRKPRTVFLLSLIIWFISSIFASPFYYHYGVTNIHDNYRQCVLLSDEPLQKYFRIYTVTLYYFIPLTIIIISYTKLLYYVYSKENRLKPKNKQNIVKWSKKRRTVTKMVAIVTLVFSLCWLPITLYIVSANILDHKTAFLYYFKMIANSFAYLNSAINPLLYAFLNRSFRSNCESMFSEPSCTLFCGEDYRHSPTQQQQQQQERQHQLNKPPPSTQIDRVSSQSTYYCSNSLIRKTRGKQLSITNYSNQLSPDIPSHQDFSDGDYELSNAECIIQNSVEKNVCHDFLPIREYELLSPDDITASNTLTTSL